LCRVQHVCLRYHWCLKGDRGESFLGSIPSLFTLPVTFDLTLAQFEFLKQISADPNDVVVGIVRDKAATEKKVAAELGERSNVHILHGDLTKHASIKQAAADTAKIVGNRGVDYLVANGAFLSQFDAYSPIGELYVYFFVSPLLDQRSPNKELSKAATSPRS
jgi:hypothetical protein